MEEEEDEEKKNSICQELELAPPLQHGKLSTIIGLEKLPSLDLLLYPVLENSIFCMKTQIYGVYEFLIGFLVSMMNGFSLPPILRRMGPHRPEMLCLGALE